jgi:hypothetical protein
MKMHISSIGSSICSSGKGQCGDTGRPLHRKLHSESNKRQLDINSSSLQGNEDGHKTRASPQKPLASASTSYEGHETEETQPSQSTKGRQTGRVGTYKREGNVSLASFGIKTKRDKKGQKVDLTKSLSQMLPYVVLATAVAALTQPASFAW